jgi:hypothetical protein
MAASIAFADNHCNATLHSSAASLHQLRRAELAFMVIGD